LRIGPPHIICLRVVGHSTGSCLPLWASASTLILCYGSQRRAALKSDKNPGNVSMYMWQCFHVHMAVYHVHRDLYPRACGQVSTWSCIHMQVAMYLCTEFAYVLCAFVCVSTCTWLCIYLYAVGHVFIHMHSFILLQNLLCVISHIAEFFYALCYSKEFRLVPWAQRRRIDNSTESHELHLEACPVLKGIIRPKIIHI
jgi:hypothetical protein